MRCAADRARLVFVAFAILALSLAGASVPAHAVVSPISVLHANDGNGNVLNKGTSITISGTVTTPDSIFNKTATEVYIQDATGGVELFQSGGLGTWHFTFGDSVTVTGTIAQFNGMTELSPLTSVTKISGGVAPQPAPVIKTCNDITTGTYHPDNTEPDEGRVVRINNVHIVSGNWPTTPSGSNSILQLSDGTANNCQLFIDKDSPVNGSPAPGDTFSIIGILHQYDNLIPYNFGYELEPRFLSDVIRRGPAFLVGPNVMLNDSTSATITWTTDKNANGRVDYGTTSSYGMFVSHANYTTSHSLTLTGLTPNTVYHFKVTTTDSLGVSSMSGDQTFITPANRPGIINVYFNKSIDATYSTGTVANGNANLATLLINRINSATYSLDCMFYSFSYSPVTDALIAAWNRGVKVRFIMDAGNSQSEMNRLIAAGIPAITSTYGGSHSGIMHNKVLVVDGRDANNTNDWVWTGSTNCTNQGLFTDAQNAIEFKDYGLAQCYTTEFNEMWGSSTDTPNASNAKMGSRKSDNTPHSFMINGKFVEQYMSPSDNTEGHIVTDINTLAKSGFFCLLTFTQDAYELALHTKWTTVPGFLVKGVFDSGNIDSASEWWDLTGQPGGNDPWVPPADVWMDGLPSGLLHHKYFIGDEENPSNSFVVTGSHNWSRSANENNDENTVIVHDPTIANLYLQEFAARYHEAGGSQPIPIPITAVEDGRDASQTSSRILLGQPWPNPTSHGLTVVYRLFNPTRPTLAVYDIAGRLVRTIVDGAVLPSGIYQARWDGTTADGTQAGAGVYVLHLTAGGLTATQRVAVVR
jgi:hypothetical protein